MLVHDRDAGGLGVVRRMERHRLAVDLDMTVGGRIDAGQQLHAGALAGTVLAKQRQHLAGAQFEGRILEGNRAAEGLCGMNQGNGDSHVPHHPRHRLRHVRPAAAPSPPWSSYFFNLLY